MKQNQPQIQTKQSVTLTKQEIHVRPLPPPEELKNYELVKQGFAERLLAMAEKEQDRRLNRQDKLIDLSRKSLFLTQLGLILGFMSVIVMALLCGYFAFLGDIRAAAWMASVVIVALAAVFVTRKFIQTKISKSEEETILKD